MGGREGEVEKGERGERYSGIVAIKIKVRLTKNKQSCECFLLRSLKSNRVTVTE